MEAARERASASTFSSPGMWEKFIVIRLTVVVKYNDKRSWWLCGDEE
jgi:hypothetical protein